MNKEIQKLKEEIESQKDKYWKGELKRQEYEKRKFPMKKFEGELKYKRRMDEWYNPIIIKQAQLQTWKQALTLKLKDVEKDIKWLNEHYTLTEHLIQGEHYDSELLEDIQKKLEEKQSSQAEIIKELGEMK